VGVAVRGGGLYCLTALLSIFDVFVNGVFSCEYRSESVPLFLVLISSPHTALTTDHAGGRDRYSHHPLDTVPTSVAVPDPNPDPSDPYVFGTPGSGSGSTNWSYGSGSFYH
jgi:hypothetical protein